MEVPALVLAASKLQFLLQIKAAKFFFFQMLGITGILVLPY
jgi:hypothetical protein